MLRSLAPARRRLVVALGALVLAGAGALVGWLVTGQGHDAAPPADQAVVGPVLLVPGYGGSTSSLTNLAAALRAGGRTVRVVSLPDGGTGDLRRQAKSLGSAAEDARRAAGSASVDVVGYSAGGVVARLWARDYGGAGLARRVITLGSPQHGTDLAATAGSVFGCPVACRQLQPDSDLLNRLNAGDETPSGPLWVSIWTTADTVVVPADSARLDGAINLTVQGICAASAIGHGDLPTDRLVMNVVQAELTGATTSTFTAADCARLSS